VAALSLLLSLIGKINGNSEDVGWPPLVSALANFCLGDVRWDKAVTIARLYMLVFSGFPADEGSCLEEGIP
jgi:hypothetical protein